MNRNAKLVFSLLAAFGMALLAGCRSVGPKTIARDRYDYSSSISDSWKRQTLLNIVKLRYLDPPIFVDVGQIVAGYTLETGASIGGQVSSPRENNLVIGGYGRFTDRPTITYTPLTGNQFVKALMTPLSPESVFFMIQAGWPADQILLATAASLGGLKNQETTIEGVTPPDVGFLRALQLFRSIQQSGAVSIRIKQDARKQQTSILTFRSADVSDTTLEQIRELRQLLRLDANAEEFALAFGATPVTNREVAVITRSILQIMTTMAGHVDVPAADVTERRATPAFERSADGEERERLVRIHSSKAKPTESFVAVPYRDAWFWIDDRDLTSKRAFAFMLMLFTLSDTGQKENMPLITIPAQ